MERKIKLLFLQIEKYEMGKEHENVHKNIYLNKICTEAFTDVVLMKMMKN